MQTKNSVKLIVDTDIGDDIDDAFALLYLCRHSCVTVEAITTVYKNTAQRAKIAKKLSGGKIPVYAGANRPLEKDVRILLGETVRENGLIDIDHYSVAASNETYEGEDAAGYIVSALRRNPHEITLLAIGPLTNLAQAAMRDKEALRLAKQIVIMGGMFAQNAPEWNIEIVPHAARIVFGSGANIVLVPYDATHLCSMTEREVEFFRNAKGECDEYLAAMMVRWIDHYDPNWDGKKKLPVLHDVLAAEVAVKPELFSYGRVRFDLFTEGENRDATVACGNGAFETAVLSGVDYDAYRAEFYAAVHPDVMARFAAESTRDVYAAEKGARKGRRVRI